jgi:hypothetical protein
MKKFVKFPAYLYTKDKLQHWCDRLTLDEDGKVLRSRYALTGNVSCMCQQFAENFNTTRTCLHLQLLTGKFPDVLGISRVEAIDEWTKLIAGLRGEHPDLVQTIDGEMAEINVPDIVEAIFVRIASQAKDFDRLIYRAEAESGSSYWVCLISS